MAALFRREASEGARSRLSGTVVLATPTPHRVLTGLLLAATLAAVLFVVFGRYASRESVGGWITPSGGLLRVNSTTPGALEQLLVAEGQVVRARQAVAVVRISRESSGGAIGQRLAGAVEAEARATDEREAAQLARVGLQEAHLSRRIVALSQERDQTLLRIETQIQQVDLARENVERAEAVVRQGYFPMTQFQARRTALLSAQDYLGQLRAAAISQARDIAEAEAQLRALPAEKQSLRADSSAQRALIAQRRITADAQDFEVLRAPRAGRVLSLPRRLGQDVSAGSALAILAPDGGALEAELFVPSRAAGFVRRGQVVRLEYAAFPYQRFGPGQGRVESVSRTVLPSTEAQSAGVKVDEPVFRVRVRLSRQTVSAYGEVMPLQPGMLLKADIFSEPRSLLQWLIDPVRAIRGR